MFAGRYFAARYFAPRYFCKVGAIPAAITWFCGLTTQRLMTGTGM